MPRSKLDRQQMISLVARLQYGEFETDEELSPVVEALSYSTGNPNVADLICHPRGAELTPEQVADDALRYRPIFGHVDEPPYR